MTLPRFRLPEEDLDDEGDATAPAQFVLKLPKSFARRLAQPQPSIHTPSVPWTIEKVEPVAPSSSATWFPNWFAERAWLFALVTAALAGVLLVGGVSAAATRGHGPVGIAHRSPKTLDTRVRASDRHAGRASTKVVRPVAHPHRAQRVTRHR